MLSWRQGGALSLLSLALWTAATLYIHLFPDASTGPVAGTVGFVTTFPLAWACVRLTRRCGGLSPDQLLPGVALVGMIALMMDGAALRWLPRVYGDDETTLRLAAAWLLWGYGVRRGAALLMAARPRGRSAWRAGPGDVRP